MALADEFGQWKTKQQAEQAPVIQEVPQQKEKPLWERAKDDIVNTVSSYIDGAKQGYDEFGRTQDRLNDMMYEQHTPEEWNQASEQSGKAVNALMHETVLPTLAFIPPTALPALGSMLATGAKETYDNTEGDALDKTGNAIRSITYGPAVDMYNDPELSQKFYDRPVSTLASGALAIGQAVLPIAGARYGVKRAGEFKNDLANRVEAKLNEFTDEAPYKNTAIDGLDALDQLDSPTRGFRPATPDEAIKFEAEQRQEQGNNLLQALEQIKQQKFDQAETITPEMRFPEKAQQQALLQALERAKIEKWDNQEGIINQQRFPEREQQQALLNTLEQLKGKKFDSQERIINQKRFPEREQQNALLQALEQVKQQKFDKANQDAYTEFMKRQQAESDALQTKKNEIASSVLMNPLDRMEVGADLPVKRTLGGQGLVFGENIIPSKLELPKPKQDIPQRTIEQPKKIPDAFDLVNQVQTKLFDQRLKDAVNKKDYPLAEQLADRMAKEGLETPLSKSVQFQKGGNKLYSGFDPTFGKFNDITVKQIIQPVINIGKSLFAKGYNTIKEWSMAMENHLGDKWDVVKPYLREIWEHINNERGSIGKNIVEKVEPEKGANGINKFPVELILDNKLREKFLGPVVEINNNGHITVRYSGVGMTSGDLNRFIKNKISEHFMEQTKEKGVFWRFTDNKTEQDLIKNGTFTRSKNHNENVMEKGISATESHYYGDFNRLKYGYKLTGEEISKGSDGEPVLDPKTIKFISKPQTVGRINIKEYERVNKILEKSFAKYGLSRDTVFGLTNFELVPSDKYFNLQNVKTKKTHQNIIEQTIGMINNEKGAVQIPNIKGAITKAGNKIYDSAVSYILNKPERTRYSPRVRQNFNPNNPIEYSLNKWDKIYQSMFDDKHPLSKLPDDKNTYYKARIANAKAHGVAEELLKRGDIDSFEQILKPVRNDLTGFSEYLEAMHSADQYIMGYKTAMSVDKMQAVIDGATPEMIKAQQKIVKYNNDLLEKLVDGGILTRESVNAMKDKFQNYVPFMRDFSDTDAMESFIKSKGNINVSNPIKKLKGSEREIIDPLESIIKNTYIFTNLAERNKVGQAFAKLAENPDFDNIVIKIDGEKTANPKLSQFTVWENGEKQAYQTTPELYRAMASLDSEGTNFVMKMIAAPASLLRAGATLTPDFMARNIVRDAIGAFINTKGFIPGVDSYKGLKHAIKKDDMYWQWMREGGGMSTMVGLDRDYLGSSLAKLKTKTMMQKAGTIANPKTALELLRSMSEKSEIATRLGVYESALKRGATPLEAIMESREASMDFGRSGTIGKNINQITAFFNASLQGTDKMIRTLSDPKTRGRAMINIALSVTLPSIVTWAMGKDDERVQRLPAWQKDLFWIIPTNGKGAGWDGLVRIPKPFEVGLLFGSGMERMLDWAYKNDPKSFKGYGGSVATAFTPSLIPTALIPLAEWWANKSYFSGQDIVPRREQSLPDRLQYGPNTSELAKIAGNITNTSPRKIDNTIRGYTGGLGTKVTEGLDLAGGAFGLVNKNSPAKPITSMPVISGFTATSYRNSQPMQDYYDLQKEIGENLAESKLKGVKPNPVHQKNHLIMNNANKVMDEFRKQQRAIEIDKKLTPDQKRAKIDDLQLKQTRLAESVLKKVK